MTKEQKDLSLNNHLNFGEKEVEITCNKHGKQKVKSFSFSGKWTEPQCRKCQEIKAQEEAVLEEKKKRDQEERARALRIEGALGRAGIPPRFKLHSFETFKTASEDQQTKKNRCEEYAKDFSKNFEAGTSMIFCGTTGTGKTHLACAIANDIIRQGRTAVFMNVIRAIRQVKETWSKESDKKEQEAINWFLNPDLLILDEIGVQFGSEAEKLILFEILNERYLNIKPTILISNLEPVELQEFIGERVMDRMKENGGRILKFDWKSHRAT